MPGLCFLSLPIKEQRAHFIRAPLVIQTTKTNPPRLAFTQILAHGNARKSVAEPANVERINLTSLASENLLLPALPSIKYRRVNLPPMRLDRREALLQFAQPPSAGAPRAWAAKPPRVTEPLIRLTQATTEVEPAWPENLTPRERRMIEQARLRPRDVDFTDLSDPLQEDLQKRVAEERQRPADSSLKGWVISGSDTRGSDGGGLDPRGLNGRGLDSRGPDGQSSGDRAVDQAADRATPAGQPAPTNYRNRESERKATNKPSSSPYRVAGFLRANATSAFIPPDDHYEIHWFREGVARQTGRVEPGPFTYLIEVGELVGVVRAELYDKYGALKATGALRLSSDMPEEALGKTEIEL
ncbi:MAG: hypothetical protein C5B49_08300, partial [Bdellovibrio sp.]